MTNLKNEILKRLLSFTGVLCLLCLGFALNGFGQPRQEKPTLNFYQIQHELLSNTVSSVYQDKFGYIWIGTYSGLHRYDGVTFHEYTNGDDPNSLGDNFVQQINEDSNNDLWIRTRNGMSRYNRESDNFTNYELPDNPEVYAKPNSFVEDDNGRLWVIGGGKGLFRFDRSEQQFIPEGEFEDMNLTSVTAAGDSVMWISTQNQGLIKFNTDRGMVDNRFTHDPDDPNSIASDAINVIENDPEGNIWIGTNDAGLDQMIVRQEETIFKHYRHELNNPNSLGNNDIFSLYIDRQGKLWAGNENGGLHLYNRAQDHFFRYREDPGDPQSLSSNSVYSIFEDREGRLWVGTGLNGLNVADPYISKFKHYTTSALKDGNWLTNGVIRDFYETEDGNVWIATDGGGLNYFDRTNETFKAFRHDVNNPHSIQSDAVIEIDQDESGNLWIGTYGGGADILVDEKKGRFVSFKEKIDNHQYPIENVFDIHFDSEHDYIWIGALREGLYRYDRNSGELRIFENDPENPTSISSNVIQHLFEDSEGNLWISTEIGLNLLRAEHKQEGRFERFMYEESDTTSIPSNVVRQVYEDSNNNIWVATQDGLAKYSQEKGGFKIFSESDGLPVSDVRSIIECLNNKLWIGTSKGISKFNPATETFRNYDKSDGLQGNEFSRHTVDKLSSGELLFGGFNGFNLFHPDSLQGNPHSPPVYMSDFKLYNQSVDFNDPESPLDQHISVTDTLVLSYSHDVFTFEFVALNYTKPEQNQYAYKLEGFEENWNYVGSQRNATYTSLAPGEYTFRVKAANNDGLWNEEGASLALVITPPFWQTTWFYIVVSLFIAGFVFGVYRMRVRSIRAHNKQLEQEVADRTTELQKKNKDLQAALQELQETRGKLVDEAHKAGMADVATGVLHNVGNVLNSINVSTSIIDQTLKNSRIRQLREANSMLEEHLDDLENFILHNPKGKKLMEYYLRIEEPLTDEYERLKTQKDRLQEKVNLIIEIIAAQQSLSRADVIKEKVDICQFCEDALTLQAGSIERHGLVIDQNFEDVDPVEIERTKVMHILFNLFNNAKESMKEAGVDDKVLTLECWQDEEYLHLSISDNGMGIRQEDMNKLFSHGFTTKKSGHGFGLHSCANYMKEMNGKISVDSEGPGKGATFTLSFPRNSAQEASSGDSDISERAVASHTHSEKTD